MTVSGKASNRLLERLRAYRTDLEGRIAFLESGDAEIRLRHEGAWILGNAPVLASLYRQYGELGALISDLTSGKIKVSDRDG